MMAKNYEYKKATIADIDELIRTRIIVLRAANNLSDDVDMSVVEKECLKSNLSHTLSPRILYQ